MNHRQKPLSACLLALAALLSTAPIQGAWAQTAPALGTASNFAVLGGAGVTRTRPASPETWAHSCRSLVFLRQLRPCVPLWERFTRLAP